MAALALPVALALTAPGGASASAPAPASDRVLVHLGTGADRDERLRAARALDAEAVTPLTAGWRAYRLEEPLTAAAARRALVEADAAGRVQLDTLVRPAATVDPHLANGLLWGLDNRTWSGGVPGADIDALEGWSRLSLMQPAVVAVIDTGVDTSHPDLASRLWTNPGEIAGNGIDDDGDGRVDDTVGWDFRSDDATVFDAADGDAHGTHVAGTIAARRGDGVGVAGVADNARIMSLKFLGPNGGYTSDAIQALDYAVAHGARVVNASWGGAGHSPALCDALSAATAAGVLVVIAAGNDAANRDVVPSWPANCSEPGTVVVAATTPTDALTGFSATGPMTVDLGAPGATIYSTVPGGYGYMSGTSMAAPHVTGIAAALLGERPGLTPASLKARILAGGDPNAALAGRTVSGRRADLTGALTANPATPPPPSISPGPDPDPEPEPEPGPEPAPDPAPDRTAPAPFPILAPAAGAVTADPRPAFLWSPAIDAESGVARHELRVDGVTVATAGPGAGAAAPETALADGRHVWTVWAIDRAGNRRAATTSRALTVDTVPPTAPRPLVPATGATVPAGVLELRFAPAEDATSGARGHRVELDGVIVASAEPGEAVRVSVAPGRHRWRVGATDGAGNAAWSAPRIFTAAGPAAEGRIVSVGGRPSLRLVATRPGRVRVSVRTAAGRPLGAFTLHLSRGVRLVPLPTAVARRLGDGDGHRVRVEPAPGRRPAGSR